MPIRLLMTLIVLVTLAPASWAAAHDPSCRSAPATPLEFGAPRAPVGPLVIGSSPAAEAAYVNSVDQAGYASIIADLCGHQSFLLGGEVKTIATRWTGSALLADGVTLARDYVADRFAAAGYEVVLQNFTTTVLGTDYPAANVIAVKTGSVSPDEILVVGAHYDSRSESSAVAAPGAEDNASGTAAVIHLAELLAGYETDRTIHFVAFGSEEYGLRGSYHYVAEALANGDQVVAALTMDMIAAWVDEFGIWIESTGSYLDLVTLVEDNTDQWTTLPRTRYLNAFGSDHIPFIMNGIPAILAIDQDWDQYADYHRGTDTFDKVDPALGTQISRVIAGSIADIAGISRTVRVEDPDLPAPAARRLELHPNVPNPFNPRTTLSFSIPLAGETRLEIFDLRGRRVRTLASGTLAAGRHERVWDGLDGAGAAVASGVYTARLVHPEGIRTQRLTLVR